MTEERRLLRRIRWWLALFIAGLVISGITAIPLESESSVLVGAMNDFPTLGTSGLAAWLITVRDALVDTNRRYPFLAYGTDWLGFAHVVIAVAFVGSWRDPVRNKWLLSFGLAACAGVIPLALIAGAARGVPFAWRLLDCSFGIVGAFPLWVCRRTVAQLERAQTSSESVSHDYDSMSPSLEHD